jgi:RimJ/RimL family protein N-acetyltransferase
MQFDSKTIFLRFVEPGDAQFILSLRTDTTYNKYLSNVVDDIEQQRTWILDYKKRETQESEFYFIIHRKSDSMPIGTVRVYDFLKDENSFCWGSWILNEKKTKYAALECTVLIYDFAFGKLGFNRCHMDMRKDNLKIIEYHKRLGVKIIGETQIDLLGHYYHEDYLKIRENLLNTINSQ